MKPETMNTIYFKTRDEWRAWLEENYASADHVWIIYYKKQTGKPRISYDDAVEEAVCFGWIDSTVRRMDDERFMQKFTPRNKKSKWSYHNIRRAEKMIREGRMNDYGLEVYRRWTAGEKEREEKGEGRKEERQSILTRLHPDFKEMLDANYLAKEYFLSLAPSYKKQYLVWINSAKREETRQKRMLEALRMLEKGKKLGMK